MLDHGRFTNLRQQEAVFCAKLLREKFRDCCDVGRDLIRALQDVARIKEIEEIWVDLLRHPEKLNPQLEGVHQLMAMPTRDIYLASRLTFDIEHKLLYILKNVCISTVTKGTLRVEDTFRELIHPHYSAQSGDLWTSSQAATVVYRPVFGRS